MDAAGERCIYMFPNVTGKISDLQVLSRFAPHIKAAKHFHTEASQLPIGPVKVAMQVARDAGVRVIFDLDVSPAFFAAAGLGTQEELTEALLLVDVLKPCKAAARELTGDGDYEQVAKDLLRLGPSTVAITLGADGCLLATPRRNPRAGVQSGSRRHHRSRRRFYGRFVLRFVAELGSDPGGQVRECLRGICAAPRLERGRWRSTTRSRHSSPSTKRMAAMKLKIAGFLRFVSKGRSCSHL